MVPEFICRVQRKPLRSSVRINRVLTGIRIEKLTNTALERYRLDMLRIPEYWKRQAPRYERV
jgi:hypothetical protein